MWCWLQVLLLIATIQCFHSKPSQRFKLHLKEIIWPFSAMVIWILNQPKLALYHMSKEAYFVSVFSIVISSCFELEGWMSALDPVACCLYWDSTWLLYPVLLVKSQNSTWHPMKIIIKNYNLIRSENYAFGEAYKIIDYSLAWVESHLVFFFALVHNPFRTNWLHGIQKKNWEELDSWLWMNML
jgi:hypothetical protein